MGFDYQSLEYNDQCIHRHGLDVRIVKPSGRGGGGRGPGGRVSGSGKAQSMVPQQRGGGANSNSGMSSERTAWLLLIGLLQKQ